MISQLHICKVDILLLTVVQKTHERLRFQYQTVSEEPVDELGVDHARGCDDDLGETNLPGQVRSGYSRAQDILVGKTTHKD